MENYVQMCVSSRSDCFFYSGGCHCIHKFVPGTFRELNISLQEKSSPECTVVSTLGGKPHVSRKCGHVYMYKRENTNFSQCLEMEAVFCL